MTYGGLTDGKGESTSGKGELTYGGGKKECKMGAGGWEITGAKTKKYIKIRDKVQVLDANNHYRNHFLGDGRVRQPWFIGIYHRPPLTGVDDYDDEYTYDDYWY